MKTLGDYHLPTKISDEFRRNEPIWTVELNTGEKVYRDQKDGMADSWLRLKEYLAENKSQYITSLYFSFRDHYESVGRDSDAFFFTNGISCFYGYSPVYHFKGGYLNKNGNILIKDFSIPELILKSEEERNINDETLKDGIIWKINNI